jgi:hypothetical protein
MTDNGSHSSGRRRRDAFEHVTLGTAIAGVIVLCVYTGLTYCAVKEGTRAANESAANNEINRRAQRAFIFINRATLIPFMEGDVAWWAFIPIWENSGNTPPVDGHMYVNHFPAPQALRPGFSKCQIGDGVEPLISIAPHGTTNVSTFNIRSSALTLFKNGNRKKFYIWGWFTYKDAIAGESHMTRFCWDVQRVIGNPVDITTSVDLPHALCDEGNCFDDDCKENISGERRLPDIPGCHMDVTEIPPGR